MNLLISLTNNFFIPVPTLKSVFILFLSCQFNQTEIGRPYSGWQEGETDIYHIYTGRGESNFFIFPDGTTMLIDAGDWDPDDDPRMFEILPDPSRRSGEWIARYIKRINLFKDQVDYLRWVRCCESI